MQIVKFHYIFLEFYYLEIVFLIYSHKGAIFEADFHIQLAADNN